MVSDMDRRRMLMLDNMRSRVDLASLGRDELKTYLTDQRVRLGLPGVAGIEELVRKIHKQFVGVRHGQKAENLDRQQRENARRVPHHEGLGVQAGGIDHAAPSGFL